MDGNVICVHVTLCHDVCSCVSVQCCIKNCGAVFADICVVDIFLSAEVQVLTESAREGVLGDALYVDDLFLMSGDN